MGGISGERAISPGGQAQIGRAKLQENGAAYRIRTYDPLITNEVLYQLS